MRIETIYENHSLYRNDFKVEGFFFGEGEKSVCMIGNMRGNEYQQLYTCSLLVQELKKAEQENKLKEGYEILVIPSANPSSINIKKRFWPIDNTDINRMFPGYAQGETTQRIAGGIFEKIKDYQYGIQFASNYMAGEFMPHVNVMQTELSERELAVRFGMPYVILRKPRPYDTTTLNYNWQIWDTQAFSLYTTHTERIDPQSARRGVCSVLNFLAATDLLDYHGHGGYLSKVIEDSQLLTVRAPAAGLFETLVKVEQEVAKGTLLARIRNPIDGEIVASLYAPEDGIIFFLDDGPLTCEHTAVIKMIQNS